MRSFTIVSAKNSKGNSMKNVAGGRYISEKPIAAAKKAFSQIRATHPKTTSATVHIQETTRGSNKKTYSYKVVRKSSKTIVELDGVPVVFKYITKIKSV